MFLISIFICLCIASVLNYFKTRRQRKHITNLKGPWMLPLIGSVQKFFFLNPKNFFKRADSYFVTFGRFSRCWAFYRLLIPTADYEFAEQLLAHPNYQNKGNILLKPWLGSGENWHVLSNFNSKICFKNTLESFVDTFLAHSIVLTERLSKVSDGRTFDLHPYISNAVLDIMIATTLGIKGGAQNEESTEYARAVRDLTALFTGRFLSLQSANNVIFAVSCPRLMFRQMRLIKKANRISSAVITERRLTQQSTLDKQDKDIYVLEMSEITKQPATVSLVDIMLSASHNSTEALEPDTMLKELNNFLFHGNLLSNSTISFALVMIARHPSVQRKLIEEIQCVRPNAQDPIYTVQHLDQLKYLDCVIRETLRLYPALPIIWRELEENFEYKHSKVGDGVMPAGAEIYIYLFDMLRQPEKFADPLAFLPERHLDAPPSRMLSFSMGPRSCVAQKFAMLLIKTVIVQLLTAYEVLPFGDMPRLEIKITLMSRNGFQVGLRPRTV